PPAPAGGPGAATVPATAAPATGDLPPAPDEDVPPHGEAPAAGAAPAQAAASTPTVEELDYAAIYGTQDYDPVADPTLPEPAQLPASYDPWERWNRKVHRFNNAVDRAIARPLARAYVRVVPRPVRLGVTNFFNNLGQPVCVLNALLQGLTQHAGQALHTYLPH